MIKQHTRMTTPAMLSYAIWLDSINPFRLLHSCVFLRIKCWISIFPVLSFSALRVVWLEPNALTDQLFYTSTGVYWLLTPSLSVLQEQIQSDWLSVLFSTVIAHNIDILFLLKLRSTFVTNLALYRVNLFRSPKI